MPITPGIYIIGYGEEFNNTIDKPYILTNNGEGKQLTVEPITGGPSQQWSIELPPGGEKDSKDRIIRPVPAKGFLAVSQDAVLSPNEVCLIKNFQVWSFEPVSNSGTTQKFYEIRSNFYTGLDGSNPLFGVDKEIKKVIIQFSPDIPHPPKRPVWAVMGPINKQ